MAGGTVGRSTSSSKTVLVMVHPWNGWTPMASLPRSLYGPRASLVEDKMRVVGGQEDDRGRGDYRNEVKNIIFHI